MLSLFRKNKLESPIGDTRLWIEELFKLAFKGFSKERISKKKLLLPNESDFPILYNGSDDSAKSTLMIVASQMEMNADDFVLTFYDGSAPKYDEDMNYNITTDERGNEIHPAAVFMGRDKDNKYQVCIEASQLHDPERLVATLAHEVGYIKMYYQYNMEKIGDISADIFPLFFGLGIFVANAPIQLYKNELSWGGRKTQKYLTKDLWGYILALYAFLREEQHPKWTHYLIPEVKKYFRQSERFIWENNEKIFNDPYQANE